MNEATLEAHFHWLPGFVLVWFLFAPFSGRESGSRRLRGPISEPPRWRLPSFPTEFGDLVGNLGLLGVPRCYWVFLGDSLIESCCYCCWPDFSGESRCGRVR